MQKKRLGASDLEITPLGVGAWAMGGAGWQFAWGAQDDDESVDAIHAALDRGINWIDTAAIYGLGHSEVVVGRAIAGRSNRPLVFTKCGIVWNEKRETRRSIEPESIRKEVEQSLSRLKLDAIDLYQIHWPEPDNLVEAAWALMAKLQQEGKGTSACRTSTWTRCVARRRLRPSRRCSRRIRSSRRRSRKRSCLIRRPTISA